MRYVDDRDGTERVTHTTVVVGRDTCLSGWGEASAGISYAGWACRDEDLAAVREWVEGRSDMAGVRVVDDRWRPSGKGDHYHTYSVTPGHPAISEKN